MSTVLNEDKELNEFKATVLENLRSNTVNVRFTKADGSQRDMLCTLVPGKIPTDKHPKSETQSSGTIGSSVRVFDVEKGEWRSFRFESLISIDGVSYV